MIEGDNYPPATWKWQLAQFLVSNQYIISQKMSFPLESLNANKLLNNEFLRSEIQKKKIDKVRFVNTYHRT